MSQQKQRFRCWLTQPPCGIVTVRWQEADGTLLSFLTNYDSNIVWLSETDLYYLNTKPRSVVCSICEQSQNKFRSPTSPQLTSSVIMEDTWSYAQCDRIYILFTIIDLSQKNAEQFLEICKTHTGSLHIFTEYTRSQAIHSAHITSHTLNLYHKSHVYAESCALGLLVDCR